MLTTARHHFVGAIGGFHGKSLGSLGGTSKAMFREPFLPMQHWTHVPFGDGSALRSAVACADFTGDPVAAVALEPIQGEGGINVAPPGNLAAAREICDEYGALLVFDEVQSGMGRSGRMFACEWDGVVPDLMALGKGFGGGVMPIGACVGTPRIWEKYLENAFPHDHLRGQPRMLLRGDCDDQCAARQILISGTYINARVLRIEPPLPVGYPQLNRFLAALEDSLQEVYRSEPGRAGHRRRARALRTAHRGLTIPHLGAPLAPRRA